MAVAAGQRPGGYLGREAKAGVSVPQWVSMLTNGVLLGYLCSGKQGTLYREMAG